MWVVNPLDALAMAPKAIPSLLTDDLQSNSFDSPCSMLPHFLSYQQLWEVLKMFTDLRAKCSLSMTAGRAGTCDACKENWSAYSSNKLTVCMYLRTVCQSLGVRTAMTLPRKQACAVGAAAGLPSSGTGRLARTSGCGLGLVIGSRRRKAS